MDSDWLAWLRDVMVNRPRNNRYLDSDRGIEIARLQTIPDWYRWDVSESQQYKMLGNGWTVEMIKHILGFMKKPASDENGTRTPTHGDPNKNGKLRYQD